MRTTRIEIVTKSDALATGKSGVASAAEVVKTRKRRSRAKSVTPVLERATKLARMSEIKSETDHDE